MTDYPITGSISPVVDMTTSGAIAVDYLLDGDVDPVVDMEGSLVTALLLEGAIDPVVAMDGFVATGPLISGSILPVVNMTASGKIVWAGRIFGAILPSVGLGGGFSGSEAITGSILMRALLDGVLVVTRALAGSKESVYESTGIRPAFPLLVYTLTADEEADIVSVPNNASFVVSATYVGMPGDPFFDAGAAPNYIGTKVVPDDGPPSIVFRPPEPNEVVWLVPDGVLYRSESNDDGATFHWTKYVSLPERFLQGMVVFDILDPDKVYQYYARLWGAMMYELTYDNDVLRRQFDPDRCSRFFLSSLAANYGLALDDSEPLTVRRSKTRNAIPAFKFKGTDRGIQIRLRDLGFSGYAREIWIDPGDPICHLVANAAGAAHNADIETDGQYITVWGMSGGDNVTHADGYVSFRLYQTPTVGDTVTISDGTLTKTFEFGSASGGHVLVAAGSSPNDTMQNLVNAINGSGLAITATKITIATQFGPPIRNLPHSSSAHGTLVAGVSDAEYREYPHGYFHDLIPRWVLSSRIAIHINRTDGSPVRFSDTPSDILAAMALKAKIADDLAFDVLCAHVDVRFFDTDLNLPPEKIRVRDTLTVTQVFPPVGPPSGFNLFPDGPIYEMLVVGTTCYVVGDFGMLGSSTRVCAAAFDINTLAVKPWQVTFTTNDPSSRLNRAWCIALGPSGEILIGGYWYSWDPTANGGSGGYVDSGFIAVDPTTGARLNPNTTPAAGGETWAVESIAVIGTAIYLFGALDNGGVMKLSSSYVVDGAFNQSNINGGGFGSQVYAGCRSADGTALYAVGGFTTVGLSNVTRRGAVKLDPTTGAPDLAFNANVDPSNAYVYSVAADSSGVYLGGYFESLGGQTAYGVGKVNKATGANVTGWAAGVDQFSFTNKNPLVYDGKVWWNGYFQQNGADPDGGRSMLVQDATTGAVLDAYDLGPDGSTFCAIPDGEGYVFWGGDMNPPTGDFAAYGLLREDKTTGAVLPNDKALYQCVSPSSPNNFSNAGSGQTIDVQVTLEHQPDVGNDHTAVFTGNTFGSIIEDIVDGLGNVLPNATLVFNHSNWNVPQTFKLHCKNNGGGTVNLVIPYTVTNAYGASVGRSNIRAQQV